MNFWGEGKGVQWFVLRPKIMPLNVSNNCTKFLKTSWTRVVEKKSNFEQQIGFETLWKLKLERRSKHFRYLNLQEVKQFQLPGSSIINLEKKKAKGAKTWAKSESATCVRKRARAYARACLCVRTCAHVFCCLYTKDENNFRLGRAPSRFKKQKQKYLYYIKKTITICCGDVPPFVGGTLAQHL